MSLLTKRINTEGSNGEREARFEEEFCEEGIG